VNKFIYRLGPPRRQDIVVFRAPPQAFYNSRYQNSHDTKDFIKRVIGLPGDRVQIRAGDGVYVNGIRLEEPYVREPAEYDWPPPHSLVAQGDSHFVWSENGGEGPYYVVPEGHVLVLGDNRNDSNDSHLWRDPITGEARPALPLENVVGRSLVIFWPPNRFGRLTR
jgi:signal peptidase I